MVKLPGHFQRFTEAHPRIASAYRELGEAVADSGPLDAKSCALIKLGMSIGAKMEGATHSQVRKAMEAGATPDEIRHAVMQATTTLGFPAMMTGLAWADDVLIPESSK